MADRAIPPLISAVALGFILGVYVAAEELSPGATTAIGVIAAAATALAAGLSVIGVPGGAGEKLIVALLRAGLGVMCFGFLFWGLQSFLRSGSLIAAPWFVLAAIFGLLLSQIRVRDAHEASGAREAPSAS